MIRSPHTSETAARLGLDDRSDRVRMKTVANLRWIAVAGQVVSVILSTQVMHLHFDTGLVWAAIGAAVLTNMIAVLVFPENRRLTETELTATLVFDMAQLWTLLMLTGGLNNPFALLVLAQVAIAALALSLRPTLFICAVAVVLWTALLVFHMPLMTVTGEELSLPPLFTLGFWAAITVGIVFQGVYAHRVTAELGAMGDALAATQMALMREQKLTDLGGVVAAAAHELGTPLATIALVSGEMVADAEDDDIREDAQLIRDQAERCRIILREMGRAGKQDEHVKTAPIVALVEEAAEPHLARGIDVRLDTHPEGGARQPSVRRRPEIIHGLRNLVQNAVDFAESEVTVEIGWSDEQIAVRISDDGPGFPSETLPRLGDPFLRNRREAPPQEGNRAAYEGMGLGLFIAKTLLERSGAELAFANGRTGGAVVLVSWRASELAVGEDRAALGENRATT